MRLKTLLLASLSAGIVLGGCAGNGDSALHVETKEMRFSPSAIATEAGEHSIVIHNAGTLTHTFSINSLGREVTIHPGKTRSISIDLAPGTYRYVCRILDHEGLGMHGVLRVSAH